MTKQMIQWKKTYIIFIAGWGAQVSFGSPALHTLGTPKGGSMYSPCIFDKAQDFPFLYPCYLVLVQCIWAKDSIVHSNVGYGLEFHFLLCTSCTLVLLHSAVSKVTISISSLTSCLLILSRFSVTVSKGLSRKILDCLCFEVLSFGVLEPSGVEDQSV